MRDVNRETYKILLFNGFSLIRMKRSLHVRRKEVCQNSWNRRTDGKLYIQTTRWKLGKHVKIYHEIMVLQHLIDPRQMASLKRAVRRVKVGTSAVLPHSGLDEKWWSDSMECYCYLRNVQDLVAGGKTPCERRRVKRAWERASSSSR